MNTYRGYVRSASGAVVSTDLSAYEMIKKDRARKQVEDGLRDDIDSLKAMVNLLMTKIKDNK
jgi:regulator of RNase E activity RraA